MTSAWRLSPCISLSFSFFNILNVSMCSSPRAMLILSVAEKSSSLCFHSLSFPTWLTLPQIIPTAFCGLHLLDISPLFICCCYCSVFFTELSRSGAGVSPSVSAIPPVTLRMGRRGTRMNPGESSSLHTLKHTCGPSVFLACVRRRVNFMKQKSLLTNPSF